MQIQDGWQVVIGGGQQDSSGTRSDDGPGPLRWGWSLRRTRHEMGRVETYVRTVGGSGCPIRRPCGSGGDLWGIGAEAWLMLCEPSIVNSSARVQHRLRTSPRAVGPSPALLRTTLKQMDAHSKFGATSCPGATKDWPQSLSLGGCCTCASCSSGLPDMMCVQQSTRRLSLESEWGAD